MAFGLVPRTSRCRTRLHPFAQHPCMQRLRTQFLPDAVYDAGRATTPVSADQTESAQQYNMLVHDTTITYEAGRLLQTQSGLNHAWAAARPTSSCETDRRRAADPRMRILSVCPQISSLHHVEATLPTIRGSVESPSKTIRTLSSACYVPANTTAASRSPLRPTGSRSRATASVGARAALRAKGYRRRRDRVGQLRFRSQVLDRPIAADRVATRHGIMDENIHIRSRKEIAIALEKARIFRSNIMRSTVPCVRIARCGTKTALRTAIRVEQPEDLGYRIASEPLPHIQRHTHPKTGFKRFTMKRIKRLK